jgi:trehalose/maltose transport system substrate-binding protein
MKLSSRSSCVALFLLAAPVAQAKTTISIACGAVGIEYKLCKDASEAWAKQTGNEVKLVSTPNDTNQKLALFQQLLSAKSADIDVFLVDIIWPGILHSHFEDLTKAVPAGEVAAHFPNLVDNNRVQGRLVALPMYVDMGLLYYRKDLLQKYGLQVPTTWQELTDAATKIQAGEKKTDKNFSGYVFQGKAYEGLTCNALEWIASYNGGAIVDKSGKISINNKQALEAVKLASSWIGSISPKGVLNYAEEEARGVFQSGQAAFMRNWPYAWALLNSKDSPISGKVGVAPLPKGGTQGAPSPTLGGWNLAVSRYSQHKPEAISLSRYLVSAEQQLKRAEFGFNPTLPALYKDAALMKKYPLLAEIGKSLGTAVARPSRTTGTDYNRVSNEFWNAIYSSLSDKMEPEAALKELEGKLERIAKRGSWN